MATQNIAELYKRANNPLLFTLNWSITTNINGQEAISFGLPLTCEFSISQDKPTQWKTAEFKVYGLSNKTRGAIFKDDIDVASTIIRRIDFYAGRGETSYLLFAGDVYKAFSSKSGGNPDITTTLNCKSGINSSRQSITSLSGQNLNIRDMTKTMIGLNTGTITDTTPVIQRGAIFGSPLNALQRYYPEVQIIIDNDVVHALREEEVINDQFFNILPSEILGTPEKSSGLVKVNVIFSPRFKIGRGCRLTSRIDTKLNGDYKIFGVSHSGTISGSVESKVTTTLTLFNPSKNLRPII